MDWGPVLKIGAALGTALAAAVGAGNMGFNQGTKETQENLVQPSVVIYMSEVMHDQQDEIDKLKEEVARLEKLVEFH